jgi:hypothetical protein
MLNFHTSKFLCVILFSDWGLGIGCWGLGIGEWGLGIGG